MPTDSSTRVQRILVIDDNIQNRQVAEGHLVAAGYAVVLAEGGEQGIVAFKEKTPDLVILDILMPGLDGFETCKRLKLLPDGRSVPVVFLTALGDLGSSHKAMESGADDFLTKPINRTELLIRVRSLLWVKRLHDELSQGYDLIRSQRDALLQAQRQKEELSALVVHDLKNPLTAILANARYLAGQEYLEEDDRAALRDVLGAAQSMHRMVMNLLDISRSEDGTLVPRLVEVDLRALIEEICRVATKRAEELKLSLKRNVGILTIRADKELLQRLVENLVDNSIKYTPAGGSIHVQAQGAADGSVEIRVTDEGHGVPQEYREKIFERYVQLDRDAEAHAWTSRGLGLAFCRLAAEAHGGRIWVEENKPKGSTFCVRIPNVLS